MDAETKQELVAKLKQMDGAALTFYQDATRIGVHPFIEFCGLMREYVSLCRAALDAGIDYTQISRHHGTTGTLPFEAFQAS